VAKENNRQSRIFQTSLKMASQYYSQMHIALLNAKLANAELEVRPEQSREDPIYRDS
jgi:hypothetical protein